ncbi:uncharacterized protein M6B38_383855 [Iris pallida]|uniref:RING-type E3 ubiquitin transferase n=1 Tax=Iris pallida TaxID=29817 RepID=A0AAX6DSL2_IRIPA|nr:uncharacterized protein M6B38_230605 [Iris pallida]KAJ6813328.1 uncharacterized protein M6B38_143470 [Iris pallida]KAJ6823311.1 uncharacterized protein M6B38_383855 [Iris pallida]
MAEVTELFLLEDDDDDEEEIDFHEEGEGEETLIHSSYWSNSSFEDDEDEIITLTPIFSPDPDPIPPPDASAGGLRIAGSDSDSDPGINLARDPELCWDCLRFDEFDPGAVSDDLFDWEEVDDRSRPVEWDISIVGEGDDLGGEEEEEMVGEGPLDFDLMDRSEFEVLFGHFADHDGPVRGGPPPAARSAVEGIPSVAVEEEEGEAVCAVCKEGMEGKARRMPCSHRYHGECILPWLAVRNTCPVCRFELPTDDPEYEGQRAERSAASGRYDLEMLFPEI